MSVSDSPDGFYLLAVEYPPEAGRSYGFGHWRRWRAIGAGVFGTTGTPMVREEVLTSSCGFRSCPSKDCQ